MGFSTERLKLSTAKKLPLWPAGLDQHVTAMNVRQIGGREAPPKQYAYIDYIYIRNRLYTSNEQQRVERRVDAMQPITRPCATPQRFGALTDRVWRV